MRCICSNEQGFWFCSQTKCKAYSILCLNVQCQCQTVNHKDCMKFIKICKFLPLLYQRNQSLDKKQIIAKVQQIYNQAIDMISIARDNLIKDIQYYEFSEYQRPLIQKLDEFKFQQINGQIIQKAFLNIKIPKIKQLKKQVHERYYQIPQQLFYEEISNSFFHMKTLLKTLNKDYLDHEDRQKLQQQRWNDFQLNLPEDYLPEIKDQQSFYDFVSK